MKVAPKSYDIWCLEYLYEPEQKGVPDELHLLKLLLVRLADGHAISLGVLHELRDKVSIQERAGGLTEIDQFLVRDSESLAPSGKVHTLKADPIEELEVHIIVTNLSQSSGLSIPAFLCLTLASSR